MFWPTTRLSAGSSVDMILNKENFTLEELLDDDEIIQECKALNSRLINFLRGKAQVEQLLHYIVEEVPEDSEKQQSSKFPFIACEILTCEIDIIVRTLVEDEQLMDLLFSFVKPDYPHAPLLAGYFSKVVACLMQRKAAPLISYIQEHPDIVVQLVDLIGITSIMEVLIRLICAEETIFSNYADVLKWVENVDVLEMIADKFSSSDSPEVHANAAEILSVVARCAPPALAAKICSPSFIGRLFQHALEESRPKSILVHSLSVCISLLDPKRLASASASYQVFRSNLSHGMLFTATPEIVDAMLDSLGGLLKLMDISSSDNVLLTTYGCLRPPLGKHRLKIVEFISVLLKIDSGVAEKELIRQSAIKHSIDLFFQYPYNNFLHHHVENIIFSCLEVIQVRLIDHVLIDCDLVGKILATEKNASLLTDSNLPTLPSEGKAPLKIGNIGHITRIANKLIQLANNNSTIRSHLQENKEWVEWKTSVLVKRNDVENIYHWACGRPTLLCDRGRDSDEDDFRERDYDLQEVANSLSQVFRNGTYNTGDIEKAQGSNERDDEDDEAAEAIICSIPLGEDSGASLFTDSGWFLLDGDEGISDRLAAMFPSLAPSSEETDTEGPDEVGTGEATAVESQPRSVLPREDDHVDVTSEPAAGVPEHTAHSADDKGLVCAEEEDRSKRAELSECRPDARDDQAGTPEEDAEEASRVEAGTERAAGEPAKTSASNGTPALASSDEQSAGSAASDDQGVDASDPDRGSRLQVKEGGSPVEVHGEKNPASR